MSAEVDALRALLQAQKALVEPQLAGNVSLVNDRLPQNALDAIQTQINAQTSYIATIEQVLVALEVLDSIGFPNPPQSQVTQDILDAIAKDQSNINAGVTNYSLQSVASTAHVEATVFDKP